MNDRIIKKTQDTLGKVIKKPPLTEKLLNKPPFRFLHDIMTSVIKTTGFMKGLYADAEMSSENVKDKESKMAFLQKALDIVSLVLGKPVSARTSKIVAGHEPEKTNEFLQMLADAINKKVDSAEYVEQVLKGDSGEGGKGGGRTKEKEKSHSSSKERKSERDRETSADRRKRRDKDEDKKEEDGERKHRSKREDKDRDREKDREDRKDRTKSRDRGREKSKDRPSSKDPDKEKDRERHRDREKDRSRDRGEDREREKRKRKEKEAAEREDGENLQTNGDASEESIPPPASSPTKPGKGKRPAGSQPLKATSSGKSVSKGIPPKGPSSRATGPPDAPARIPRPSSAKGSRRRHRDDEELPPKDKEERSSKKREETTMNGSLAEEDMPPQGAAPKKLARPSSARPAPPRVKKNEQEPQEVHVVGQSNVPNVIVDKKGEDSDDDDNFIAKEEEPAVSMETSEPPPTHNDLDEEGGEHGGLVKKILETKKELEGGSTTQQKGPKKTEIERSHMNDATKRKEREMIQKEIDKLQSAIQTLTRSANPLGKIMDFVQEDLDSMQKELDMWRKEHKRNVVALQREHSVTETSIEPLRAQLTELDQAITDQVDLIAAVKANIIRNDERMEKMLGSVTKS